MAKLKSEKLALEFRFQEFDAAGWVQYEILFLWEDAPIVNDALLKREGDYWSKRSFGAFKANDDERDSLVTTLERVLESNQADYWEPLEPDIIIAIYPDMYFPPFLPSHLQLVWESEKRKQEREEHKRGKREKGKLPDDPITLIIFVDAYNLKNADTYYGDGIALVMCPTREELTNFTMQLKQEYAAFCKRHNMNQGAMQG